DEIVEHEEGRRLVAFKNVTVNEEFFQGHFPGAPLLPAVLMLESLTQVASLLLLQRAGERPTSRVFLRGVNDARFRRQVVPGDRLRLEISLGRKRTPLVRAEARAFVGDQIVAECVLLLGLRPDRTAIHPAALVDPRAAAAGRPASAIATSSWPTSMWPTTATSATTRFSVRMRRSAATSPSRTTRTSARDRPSTSSAASDRTASSAAIRW